MVIISNEDFMKERSPRSEFQVKPEEVSVVKKTLDGQNFKSRMKKSQSLVRPWMLRSSNEDEEGEKSPKQPIAGLQLTGTQRTVQESTVSIN